MKTKDLFPSKYLKFDDLPNDVTMTIKRVVIEEIGQGQDKDERVVIYFREIDKGMVANKTNCLAIERQHGGETDNWIGKHITLGPDQTSYQGKPTDCIRVRLGASASKQTSDLDVVTRTEAPMSFSEAVVYAASYGLPDDWLKGALKDAGLTSYNAQRDTALVLKLVAEQTKAAGDADETF